MSAFVVRKFVMQARSAKRPFTVAFETYARPPFCTSAMMRSFNRFKSVSLMLARGTRPDSKAVTGRLDALPALAASVGEGPALLVIGEAVSHSALWNAASSAQAEAAA